jgi:hypothetical protein
MENIKEIQENIAINNSVVAYIVIDRGNGEFTSMTKAHYQAEQSTPIDTEDE